MSKTPSTRSISASKRLRRSARTLRRYLDYQLLVLMIRLGLVQPAQVRVRTHR